MSPIHTAMVVIMAGGFPPWTTVALQFYFKHVMYVEHIFEEKIAHSCTFQCVYP